MSQEVRVSVNAKTDEAAANIRKVEAATDGLADSTERVAKASREAAEGMQRMQAIGERLKGVQGTLSKELGKPVDAGDAALFLANFEKMKTGRGLGMQKTKAFGSFEDWYAGHSTMYRNQADAARHRRYILGAGMQQTDYARQYGIPAFGGGPGGSEGSARAPAPSMVESGIQRSGAMAMGFGKGMLALAGITTVAGMMGQGLDMATEKAVTLDTLKRSMGDLGVSFEGLKTQVESAARGMGLTTVEASRLAAQFAQAQGNGAPTALGAKLNTAVGLARAFGMDPADAAQFMGSMSKLGATGGSGDRENRKFALMIAEAINKSGYMANASEIVNAIQGFATRAASLSLSTPDTAGFAGMLADLMGTGRPGLDAAGASSIIGAADASIRAGGGMGQAGLNFTYAALMRGTRGMSNPIAAEALWQGGFFGSTANQMAPGTALGDYMARHRMSAPMLSGATNFGKMRDLLKRQYGDGWNGLEAMQNVFGLKSIAQASALMDLNGSDLTGSQRVLARAGVSIGDLSASGIQDIVGISGAKNMSDLMKIYGNTIGRSDLSDAEKKSLSGAAGSGDFNTLQDALVRAVSAHGQEQTAGSEWRESVVTLKDALTGLGTLLMDPLDKIREAVQFMAKAAGDNSTYTGSANPRGGGKGGPGAQGMYDRQRAAASGAGVFPLNDEQVRSIYAAAGGDPAKAALMRALVATENRGFGHVVNTARSPAGAFGPFQMMPGTWNDFGGGLPFSAASNFDASAKATSKFIDWIEKRYGTRDPDVVAAYFNGGDPAARAVMAGKQAPTQETRDYLTSVDAALGNTPMPQGSGGPVDRDRLNVHVTLDGETCVPAVDGNGRQVGTTTLTPYVAAPPAGGMPARGRI